MIDDMKKILLLALPLMVMCAVSCEKDNGNENAEDNSPIIEFNDTDFLNALLVERKFESDYDYDGNILKDETIYIEQNVDKNNDDKISVNEASQVKYLALYDVENYEGLNITDISEIKYFTSLTVLHCIKNQLTAMDLTACKNLVILNCCDNKLTTIDLSNNLALTHLYCENNPLHKIILHKDNKIDEYDINLIIKEYGDIIEYVE